MFTFFPKMDVGKKSHVNMQHLFLMHRPHEGERRRSTPSLAGAWNPRPVAWQVEPCVELPGKLKFPLPSLLSTALTVAECDDTSKEKGDLLKGCERGAGKGILGKKVGEGRDDGLPLGSAVGAGKNDVEFVTQGVGGAVTAVAELVGDVPAGCREVELVGWEGATLASQTKEGGRECVLFIGTNSVTSTPQWIRQPVEGRAEDRGERQGDVTKEHERGRCSWRCWN